MKLGSIPTRVVFVEKSVHVFTRQFEYSELLFFFKIQISFFFWWVIFISLFLIQVKKKKGISCYSSGVEYRCGRVTQDKNRRHFLFQIKGKEEGRNGTGLLSAILQKIWKKINKIKPIQQEKRRIKKSFLSSASCFSCYPASGRIGCCSFAFLCWKCIKQLISRHLNDWCSRKSAAMDLIAIEVDGLLELLAVNGIKSFWFFLLVFSDWCRCCCNCRNVYNEVTTCDMDCTCLSGLIAVLFMTDSAISTLSLLSLYGDLPLYLIEASSSCFFWCPTWKMNSFLRIEWAMVGSVMIVEIFRRNGTRPDN